MTPHAFQENLDKFVPWMAFAYGAIMIFVLSQPKLIQLANERLPEPHRSRFFSHQPLAWLCLVAGAFWILQGLWG